MSVLKGMMGFTGDFENQVVDHSVHGTLVIQLAGDVPLALDVKITRKGEVTFSIPNGAELKKTIKGFPVVQDRFGDFVNFNTLKPTTYHFQLRTGIMD